MKVYVDTNAKSNYVFNPRTLEELITENIYKVERFYGVEGMPYLRFINYSELGLKEDVKTRHFNLINKMLVNINDAEFLCSVGYNSFLKITKDGMVQLYDWTT